MEARSPTSSPFKISKFSEAYILISSESDSNSISSSQEVEEIIENVNEQEGSSESDHNSTCSCQIVEEMIGQDELSSDSDHNSASSHLEMEQIIDESEEEEKEDVITIFSSFNDESCTEDIEIIGASYVDYDEDLVEEFKVSDEEIDVVMEEESQGNSKERKNKVKIQILDMQIIKTATSSDK